MPADETTYTYYDSGDLASRTDARSVSVSYTYDALRRTRVKNYSDSTPDVTYSYYAYGAGNIGRLQSVISSVATETFNGYDSLGRVLSHTQTITGNAYAYTQTYKYRLDDSIATHTYPSGRVLSYTTDDAGRTRTVSDGTTTYADLSGATTDDDSLGRVVIKKINDVRTEDAFAASCARADRIHACTRYEFDSPWPWSRACC